MGKVKDQLWDEWEAERKYSEYMDSVIENDYAYDMNDDWLVTPTEDMCGTGINITLTDFNIDANEEQLKRDVGVDIVQKINKTVEEMGGIFYDEIPF